MTTLIEIDNLYNGKYLATVNKRDASLESKKGVKYLATHKLEDIKLKNTITGELVISNLDITESVSLLVTEKVAISMGWIKPIYTN